MQHNRKLMISTAGSRKSIQWPKSEILWSDAPMDVSVDQICRLMGQPISWAPGLILRGAGFENDYYMKD